MGPEQLWCACASNEKETLASPPQSHSYLRCGTAYKAEQPTSRWSWPILQQSFSVSWRQKELLVSQDETHWQQCMSPMWWLKQLQVDLTAACTVWIGETSVNWEIKIVSHGRGRSLEDINSEGQHQTFDFYLLGRWEEPPSTEKNCIVNGPPKTFRYSYMTFPIFSDIIFRKYCKKYFFLKIQRYRLLITAKGTTVWDNVCYKR